MTRYGTRRHGIRVWSCSIRSLLKDAESTSQRAALDIAASVAEELATIRLPPATPPPPAHFAHLGTGPMPAMTDAFPPQSRVPSMDAGATHPRGAHAAAARPSWLQALLTSTFPPAAPGASPEVVQRARRNAAAACVGFALAFALVAMISGLRGAPDDPAMAPAVAAALVVAHALVALGAGAFSFGLLRMAERLLGE